MAEHCLPDSLLARRQVILIGMEAHVCVLQTALELKAAGKEVFVVTDCISSRAQSGPRHRLAALSAGRVWLVSREMVLFEMLRSSGHPQFRQISQQYLVPVLNAPSPTPLKTQRQPRPGDGPAGSTGTQAGNKRL